MITADDGREVSSIGRAIRLLGDRWTLLILRDAFLLHTRRFRGWRESLGISDPVLARRLRDLVDAGILRRVPYSSAPERHEYLLTDSSLELWSLLVAIWAWERRWVVGKAEILPELIHDRCSAGADARLGCASCGAVVGARDTAGERSPGADPERNAPPRFHRRSAPGEGETIALLGDRWSMVMLAAALLGTRRFGDFQRDLGVPPTLLSHRLRTMVRLDVLRRVPTAARSDRHEYRLTDKGLDFFPIMMLMDGDSRRVPGACHPSRVWRGARAGAALRPLRRRPGAARSALSPGAHAPACGGPPPCRFPRAAEGAMRLERADGVSSP